MAKIYLLIFAVLVAALVLANANGGGDINWMPVNKVVDCQGSVGNCMGGELEMENEINRRMLAGSNYISYGALQANNVPCSRRGASYYNCQPGADANPYTRSCTAATKCRS